MLRILFNEEKRKDEGLLFRTNQAIDLFGKRLRARYAGYEKVPGKWIRLELWADGLKSALNELEQSIYCSGKYAAGIRHSIGRELTEEAMTEEERCDYYRHVYFYKNAFIRVFSTLDKTGYFLDTIFDANTAALKEKFSYFTVLRRLHDKKMHPGLEDKLFQLKVQYREPLDRLRKRRNLEIHSMNAELIDEMWRARSRFAEYHRVEPIDANMQDLKESFGMVCGSLHEIFTYCANMLK